MDSLEESDPMEIESCVYSISSIAVCDPEARGGAPARIGAVDEMTGRSVR
jgi:hypothetical protein